MIVHRPDEDQLALTFKMAGARFWGVNFFVLGHAALWFINTYVRGRVFFESIIYVFIFTLAIILVLGGIAAFWGDCSIITEFVLKVSAPDSRNLQQDGLSGETRYGGAWRVRTG